MPCELVCGSKVVWRGNQEAVLFCEVDHAAQPGIGDFAVTRSLHVQYDVGCFYLPRIRRGTSTSP